jgi:hypothetical protein
VNGIQSPGACGGHAAAEHPRGGAGAGLNDSLETINESQAD